ncbi:hypothetical protein HA45_12855 [Pantoea rodasii]|uniref:hypothetical protein n=1 Tax=Pantoea rodasii TaxID=1076549 RepID=UPI000A234F4D|nr:hypothetical protein [Pantoea rodasii]ORM63997.1 hypothetical protein HA45_12855 [Pantoea rodasii]
METFGVTDMFRPGSCTRQVQLLVDGEVSKKIYILSGQGSQHENVHNVEILERTHGEWRMAICTSETMLISNLNDALAPKRFIKADSLLSINYRQ